MKSPTQNDIWKPLKKRITAAGHLKVPRHLNSWSYCEKQVKNIGISREIAYSSPPKVFQVIWQQQLCFIWFELQFHFHHGSDCTVQITSKSSVYNILLNCSNNVECISNRRNRVSCIRPHRGKRAISSYYPLVVSWKKKKSLLKCLSIILARVSSKVNKASWSMASESERISKSI